MVEIFVIDVEITVALHRKQVLCGELGGGLSHHLSS